MFKFVAIAVIATVAIAQEEEEVTVELPEGVTMENCMVKDEETMALEAEDETAAAACAVACEPVEWAEMDEETKEGAAEEMTEEAAAMMTGCAINCTNCSNFGAVEESASALIMGATVAFAAAALF